MTKFLTEETPVKVVSLLGTAVASMFFLFAVTVTTSSQQPFPEGPFAPQTVVAMLDNTSHAYAAFLDENLFQPASAEVAFVKDNVGFIADNAGPELVSLMGLQNPSTEVAQATVQPEVAGASTEIVQSKYYPTPSGASIFSFLLGN